MNDKFLIHMFSLLFFCNCTAEQMQVFALSMQAASQSMRQSTYSNRTTYSSLPATSTEDENDCSSDYECSYGMSCLKRNFQSIGTCVQTVNRYGLPTYAPPRLDSFGPNMGNGCSMVGNSCPIGFYCDYATSACLKF